MKESELYKKEVDVLQRHVGKRKFKNERLQRLVTIFTHPGASLLGNAEFKEVKKKIEIWFSPKWLLQSETDFKFFFSTEIIP